MKHFFYIDGVVWHGFRYWKMDSLAKGEVIGWNTRYLPYTIRKITAQQIMVESVCQTVRIVLKRRVMENIGKQYHTRFHEYFYAQKPLPNSKDWNWEGPKPFEAQRFSWGVSADDSFTVLGLTRPCSQSDVKRAYKRLALKTHPDLGGTSAAFIKLKQAYDSALRFTV